MSANRASASSAIAWITGSVQVILKNPVAFLVMGLIMAVIGLVPLLGGLVTVVIGPALYGGIVYAAREQEEGRNADIAHLFRAFSEPGKIGPMIMLCLPSIAGAVVVFILVLIFLGGALLGGGLSALSGGSTAAVLGALGGSALILLPLLLAVALAVYAFQFFAIPRVMLEGAEPMAAMKDSFSECLANAGAYLVFVGVLMAVFIVLAIILSVLGILGSLFLGTVLAPVVACGLFLAWKERHGGQASLPGEVNS